MHMLFPFSSVCESFVCFLPSGVVSLEKYVLQGNKENESKSVGDTIKKKVEQSTTRIDHECEISDSLLNDFLENHVWNYVQSGSKFVFDVVANETH